MSKNKELFFLFLFCQALNLTDLILTIIFVHILKTAVEINPIIQNLFILVIGKLIVAEIIFWLWKTKKNKMLAFVAGIYLGALTIMIMNLLNG